MPNELPKPSCQNTPIRLSSKKCLKKYRAVAQKGYDGILKNFVQIDEKQGVHLINTCSGAGLGGVPYRSGTFDYYIHEPLRTDDMKGIGVFIQADLEMKL